MTAAEVVDDPMPATRELRSPGSAVPGRVKAGVWRSPSGREVVAVRRGRGAVRLRLAGHRYDSVLVSADDADSLAAELDRRRHPSS